MEFVRCSFSFASPTLMRGAKPSKGRRRELTEEENDEIKEAFDLFDNDKDNELDYHEFKVIVCRSIEHPSVTFHSGRSASVGFRRSQERSAKTDA